MLQGNTLWNGSGASIESLLTVHNGIVEITNSVFARTTKLDSGALLMGIIVRVDNGELNMRSNCFVGNDESIAPIVADKVEVHTEALFLQRRSATMAPTGCEFISHVKTGSLDVSAFNQTEYNCMIYQKVDICTASIAKKVANKMPCESSLDSIAANEANIESSSPVRTYVLCPDTTYNVGSSPLALSRPNMHIICGINGDSDNECILSGGAVQLVVSEEYWIGETRMPALNILLRGIRFVRATSTNVLIDTAGEVLFHDCAFSVSSSDVATSKVCVTQLTQNLYSFAMSGKRKSCVHIHRNSSEFP